MSARRARVDRELDERITSTVADPADTPEAALQEKRRGELLRESLAKLSPEHSEVIDLVYYHGKSVREVAEIVGVGEAEAAGFEPLRLRIGIRPDSQLGAGEFEHAHLD